MRKLLIEKVKKVIAYIVLGVFGTIILGTLSFATGAGMTMGESSFLVTLLFGLVFWVIICLIGGIFVWALYEAGLLD